MVMGNLTTCWGQSDPSIDMVQATSEPLTATRLKFFSQLILLRNHTRDTTPMSNSLPSDWEPVTKTERHKRKSYV